MRLSLSRVATWVIALLVGAVYGLAGTIAHSFVLWGFFPLGLLLAVIGGGALVIAVRLLTIDRWATLAAGLGMLAATLMFSGPGPGGSVIVAQAPEGQFDFGLVWTIAVPIIVAVAVAWPDFSKLRPGPQAEPPTAN